MYIRQVVQLVEHLDLNSIVVDTWFKIKKCCLFLWLILELVQLYICKCFCLTRQHCTKTVDVSCITLIFIKLWQNLLKDINTHSLNDVIDHFTNYYWQQIAKYKIKQGLIEMEYVPIVSSKTEGDKQLLCRTNHQLTSLVFHQILRPKHNTT